MEALAALGLAGNVIQFVDYAQKLVSGSREIYKSATGLTAENDVLDAIIRDVLDLSGKIADCCDYGPSDAGARLKRLADESEKLAQKIIGILSELRRKGGSNSAKWQAVVQFVRSARKSGELQQLAQHVQNLQAQLNLHLTYIISDRESQVLQTLKRLEDHAIRMDMNRVKDLRQLRTDMKECLKATRAQAKLGDGDIEGYFDRIVRSKAVSPSDTGQVSERFGNLSSRISSLVSESAAIAIEQRFLDSLQFKQIRDRLESITESTPKTFDWIFETGGPKQKGSLPFLNWLRYQSELGIFYITGKAGSGKSTFMKYIYRHENTGKHLREWSGSKALITADFYFWNSGTSLQKSQEGLLRSLLFEILRQCPRIIPAICDYYNNESGNRGLWTKSALKAIFSKLQQQDLNANFAFFVDGLDEYDGDYSELIELLQELAKQPNVKLCVSSRPYYVFKDALGKDEQQLKLEDFTEDDIREFVQINFDKTPRFGELCKVDERYKDFIQEVVDKAQGVFLWVVLVVRSLTRGFTNEDDISDLQKRLSELPETLEGVFREMFRRIEQTYKERTARIFLVALAAPELSLTVLSFIANGTIENVLEAQSSPMSDSNIGRMHEAMRRRLSGSCDGLLEVQRDDSDLKQKLVGARNHDSKSTYTLPGDRNQDRDPVEALFAVDHRGIQHRLSRLKLAFFEAKVSFMHRSVRDFLRLPDMQNMLVESAGSFDAREALGRGLLVQLKTLHSIDPDRGHLQSILEDIAYFARELEDDKEEPQTALLNEVEKVLQSYSSKLVPKAKNLMFLDLAVQYGLRFYVEKQLDQQPDLLQPQFKLPLLGHALKPAGLKYGPAKLDVAMIEMLLSKGAELCTTYNHMTLWSHFVFDHFVKQRRLDHDSDPNNLPIVTRYLISRGADPQEQIPTDRTFDSLKKTKGPLSSKAAGAVLVDSFRVEEVEGMIQGAPNSNDWKGFLHGRQDKPEMLPRRREVASEPTLTSPFDGPSVPLFEFALRAASHCVLM